MTSTDLMSANTETVTESPALYGDSALAGSRHSRTNRFGLVPAFLA